MNLSWFAAVAKVWYHYKISFHVSIVAFCVDIGQYKDD